MPVDAAVSVGPSTSTQPRAHDMQLTVITAQPVANQVKTHSRQASKIESRVIKIETSRSSCSAFILSPQGSEVPLLESVLGAKPWLLVVSLSCYLNALQIARSFSGLLNLTNSKERAKFSWSLNPSYITDKQTYLQVRWCQHGGR